MGWAEAMNRVLPELNGLKPHVTSGYNAYRTIGTSPHIGIDFNYIGGQAGINLTYPEIKAPISGKITAVGGRYRIIRIKYEDGFYHDMLQTQKQNVKLDNIVVEGSTVFGTMGARRNGCSPRALSNH